MTGTDSDEARRSAILVAGAGLVVGAFVFAGLAAANVTVSAAGYAIPALAGGAFAISFCVWGLLGATKGRYRRGVGALSGAAGLVLIFLAPQARSRVLFVATGALIVLASGLFLLGQGLGYELIAVDDVTEADESGQAAEAES